jgi:hypothetical protein
MPDPLYLSLWFHDSEPDDALPNSLAVMRQFPFSAQQPGITYLAVHPVSWNEATVLEQRYSPGITPEQAVLTASDLLHEDYGYIFEAAWDLWGSPALGEPWSLQPAQVKFIVRGMEFDEGAFEQEGEVQVDFGMDTPFLYEETALTPDVEAHVRANVKKLVDFTVAVEKNAGLSSRLLWSESEENLAQKLIARLQRVQ